MLPPFRIFYSLGPSNGIGMIIGTGQQIGVAESIEGFIDEDHLIKAQSSGDQGLGIHIVLLYQRLDCRLPLERGE